MAKRGKNKQKQRVAFRKNRGKRSRNDNKLTRDASGITDADDAAGARVEDMPSAERLSGKGDLTRSRTVIVQDGDESGELGYVGEGFVTEEIKSDFAKLGWSPVPYDDDFV